MSYLAKTIIQPVLGQYLFSYPASTAVLNHIYTPIYNNGTSTFTSYASISGNGIILQPGDYFIECYLGGVKNAFNNYVWYNLVIDGVDAVAPKGRGFITGYSYGTTQDGFQYDLTVNEGATKTIQVRANAVSGTVTYNTNNGTMLIWRL